MDLKSKGMWRQKGLTKANIDKFNTFKKINYKVLKSEFSVQLSIYQALGLIDKDVTIVKYRGDEEA